MTLQQKYDAFYQGTAMKPRDIEFSGWPRDRTQAVIAVPMRGEVVLDVGCGDGKLLYQLRNRFRRLVGVEHSASRLDAARSNLSGYAFVPVCGSAESMPENATGNIAWTSQPKEGMGSDVLFEGGHLHYLTFRLLSLLLQRSGFVIERRMGFGRLGRLHDLVPSLLSVGVQLVARKPA